MPNQSGVDAVGHVVAALSAGVGAGRVANEHLRWRDDALMLVAQLAAAVEIGSALAFRQYVQWQHRLLMARRLPTEELPRSLRLLDEYFRQALPEDGRQAVLDLISSGMRALDEEEAVPEYALEPAGHDAEAEILAETLVDGDAAAACAQLLAASRDAWLPEVVARIVRPAMRRVGWWWQAGRISVAQEHLATGIAHRAVDNVFTHAPRKPRRPRSALFACVEGNRHALGMRTLADAFEIEGWAAFNLGADVPTASLPGMLRALGPELVGLSVSMTTQLPAARTAVDAIRAQPGGAGIRVMLGGLASDSLGEAWRWVGADAAAGDAPQALAVAEARQGR